MGFKQSDGVLVWLNILFLMFAALVPLATKVNNTYEYQTTSGLLFYFTTSVISILTLLAMWIYSTRGYKLVDNDLDEKTIKFVSKTIMIGTVIFIISLIGQFISSWFGYIAFIALAYMIIATAYGDHIPFSKR